MKGVVLLFTREARKQFGGLSQNSLLSGILVNLEREFSILKKDSRIKLTNSISVEIANDIDWDRRIGTMSYKEISLLKIDRQLWTMSIGTKSGAYPGENTYASDIVAIPLDRYDSDDELVKAFSDQITIGKYFKNSLLIGTVPGYIVTTGNSFFAHSVPSTMSNMDDLFENKRAQENTECINLDRTPIYTSFATYKPAAIKAFADSIAFVLLNYKLLRV